MARLDKFIAEKSAAAKLFAAADFLFMVLKVLKEVQINQILKERLTIITKEVMKIYPSTFLICQTQTMPGTMQKRFHNP